jgi:hypothetical protein
MKAIHHKMRRWLETFGDDPITKKLLPCVYKLFYKLIKSCCCFIISFRTDSDKRQQVNFSIYANEFRQHLALQFSCEIYSMKRVSLQITIFFIQIRFPSQNILCYDGYRIFPIAVMKFIWKYFVDKRHALEVKASKVSFVRLLWKRSGVQKLSIL